MKKIIIGFFGVSLFLASCATIQNKIGDVALKFMTKKEANFSNIAAIGMYQSNLYSLETGISMGSKADWEEGQNAVGVQLVKPDGSIGFINLDGTITIDGVTAVEYGGGVYMALFDANDNRPKTVELTSSNGEKTSFNISPAPAISIKSINGMSQGATIDLNTPLELELEYNSAAKGKRIVISLITKAVGAKGFANFQSVLIDNKVTIPAEAFMHKHITGGGPTGKDVTNWQKGENHLQISIVNYERDASGQPFSYFRKESKSYDTVPVTVTGDAGGRTWVKANGDSEEASGKFKYSATASNAWYARPLNTKIDRIGVSSLSVSGTLFKQEVETSERDNYSSGYREITTTTTTFQFPELDDQYWNQYLENMYADLTGLLKNEYGASVVDVNQITANPIYDEFYTPDEENTMEYIAKNLRNTKRLIPRSIGEILGERTTAMIADGETTPRLIRDMNMDAFMDVVINYQVAGGEGNKIVLVPNVSYRIIGQTQAFDGTSNVWLQGTIQGPGIPFSEAEFSDLNALNRIGQKDVIIKLIKQSIADLTSKQSEFGYDKVWNTALVN